MAKSNADSYAQLNIAANLQIEKNSKGEKLPHWKNWIAGVLSRDKLEPPTKKVDIKELKTREKARAKVYGKRDI